MEETLAGNYKHTGPGINDLDNIRAAVRGLQASKGHASIGHYA